MKSDDQLKRDVEAELNWDPSISDAGIVVSTHDGIVTLTGRVPYFVHKVFAEKAAQHVAGVRAVTNEIQVTPDVEQRHPNAGK